MSTLGSQGIVEKYVRDCGGAWEAFKNSGVPAMRAGLIDAVNTALGSSGVPRVTSSVDATSAASGAFMFPEWKIEFGGASQAAGKSSAVFVDHVNTVYHEARHCEQWFRMAQALSQGQIVIPIYPDGRERPGPRDAGAIARFMGIPGNIAILAVAPRPIVVRIEMVRDWFTSIYGPGGAPRNIRLLDPGRHLDYLRLAEERDAWQWGDAAGDEAKSKYNLHYPNLYDWLLYTKRSWHFRSGKFFGGDDSLKTLDAAIVIYDKDRSVKNRDALKKTFNAWYAANPKEATKRDVKPPGEAEGCITKLRNFVNRDRGAVMGGVRMV